MDSRITARRNFLKKQHSPLTFGFTAIADYSSFIGQEYLAGIMKACENYGINFINMSSALRPSIFIDKNFFNQHLAKTAFLHAPFLDGLISWASSLAPYMKSKEIQDYFSSLSSLPIVDIGYLDLPGISSIRIDNDYSIRLLVEHLVKVHGYSKIAFFGSKYSLPHQLRLNAFIKEMKNLGLKVEEGMIYLADSLDEQDIAFQVEKMLHQCKTFSSLEIQAILTSSDIIASHIISTLEKHSIKVPEDMAVTGFNNQLAGLNASTPITTIDLAYYKRGYEAVELLLDKVMSGKNSGEIYNVPTSLVIRQSCGCYEEAIIESEDDSPLPGINYENLSSSEMEARSYLDSSISISFPRLSEDEKSSLIEALLSDLYDTNVPPPHPLIADLVQKSFKRPSLLPTG
ncbi:MAG: LacI family transcriptional regulator [Treponema sp.]|nr:LacI family transcriptional regulator [Treponema sp.]